MDSVNVSFGPVGDSSEQRPRLLIVAMVVLPLVAADLGLERELVKLAASRAGQLKGHVKTGRYNATTLS